jgi:hypothetical protein
MRVDDALKGREGGERRVCFRVCCVRLCFAVRSQSSEWTNPDSYTCPADTRWLCLACHLAFCSSVSLVSR